MAKPTSKYFIKTFGCQQNVADSERIEGYFKEQGMKPAKDVYSADYIVINTCMVRQSAENRIYGLVNNLSKLKIANCKLKIVVTGCMIGLAFREKSGSYLQRLKTIMPVVDEFIPIEEIGFEYSQIRKDKKIAYVPISNGCNNFCTYCVVPFSRGREISRPYEDIINECQHLIKKGCKNVTLLGMNVNSYGADLILGEKNIQVMRDLPEKDYFSRNSKTEYRNSKQVQNSKFEIQNKKILGTRCQILNTKPVKPVFVKHLGRLRIPTLFPYLLEDVAKLGFNNVNFISSNPWDFSNELIGVIARNKNISRTLHIAVQSGDNAILKKMNRWYNAAEFIKLINKLKARIKNLELTTDIIVGFPGETEQAFKNTVKLCKKAKFKWAYISMYSPRPMTASNKFMDDNVPFKEKRRRWLILDNLINQPQLKKIKQDNYTN